MRHPVRLSLPAAGRDTERRTTSPKEGQVPVRPETQRELAQQVVTFLESGSTSMAADVFHNPVADYTDVHHLQLETTNLFRVDPLLIGHASQCANPRDFLTRDVAGVPVLVVRQRDSSLAAFLNVCRHRGSKVEFDACGQRNSFSCRYHAWTYRLDGSLASVPHSDDFGPLDRAKHGLVALPVVERHGLVWVGLTPGTGIDVAAHLGPELDAELASYGLEGFVVERTETRTIDLNWKVVIDGFLETYHLGVLHRTTIGPHIRTNVAPFRSFGAHGCMTAVRTSFDKIRYEDLATVDAGQHLVHAYNVFPNSVMVWSGKHMELWISYPVTGHPGHTNVTVHVLGEKSHVAEDPGYFDRNWIVITDTVLTEDFMIGQSIQQGFTSGAQTHVTFGRNEPGVQHFHRSLAERVRGRDVVVTS